MSEAPGNALNLLYLQIGQRHEWALSPALSTVKCLLNKRLLRPLKSSSRPHYHSSGVGCWHLAGRSTRSWARGPSRKIANKGPFPHSLSLRGPFFIFDSDPHHARTPQAHAPVETGRSVRGLCWWSWKGQGDGWRLHVRGAGHSAFTQWHNSN